MGCPLEDDLRLQLTTAMRARDSAKANWVRMITTKITERRTAEGFSGVVDDVLVLDVLASYRKQLEKAKIEFQKAGERAAAQIVELDQEIAWCATMLPAQLTETELRAALTAAIADLPTKDVKMAGRVIGALKKQFGDRVDSGLAKSLAEQMLSA